jgi:hypothetical protein
MEEVPESIEKNSFNINDYNYIRASIENMNKFNQTEVLRILHKHNNVNLNENKYGVHINLTDLPNDIIEELLVYIKYVNTQEITLNTIEKQKEDYRNTYFVKDIKDKET